MHQTSATPGVPISRLVSDTMCVVLLPVLQPVKWHACWVLLLLCRGVLRLVTAVSVGLIDAMRCISLFCRSSTETAGTVGSSAELPKSTSSNAVADVSVEGEQHILHS